MMSSTALRRSWSPPSQLYPYSTVNEGMLEVVPEEAAGASLCWGEDWNWPMHTRSLRLRVLPKMLRVPKDI